MAIQKTILVIDDDQDIRDALASALRSGGYGVLCAANGLEALPFLRPGAGAPSLVILDLMMPVMDGWEFRARQLQDAGARAIPVIVLSAGGNVEKKAQNLGASGWLRKPVKLQVLLETVRATLAGSAERAS